VLRREGARFYFDRLTDYARAKEAGFGTPELDQGEHLSSLFLFSIFAQRIPSKSRPDFDQMMQDWGVSDPDDRFEILAASGGRLKSDRIELCEERAIDDSLEILLRFRVAGVKYAERAAYVQPGDVLQLRAEPTNAQDTDATLVLLWDGRKLGYVPRPYVPLFSKLLREHAPIKAKAIRELNVPGDEHRWVVEAWRDARDAV
jgi:HIRAN domain